MRNGRVRLIIVLSLIMFLGGCGTGPHPRMGALLEDAKTQQGVSPIWPELERVGLIVHSDETGPGAAPSISQSYIETLFRRTEEFLIQTCRISAVVPIPLPFSRQKGQFLQDLTARGREQGLSHILVVLFSSHESSSPVTLGEERMMTQMGGISVENSAQSEVALLRLEDSVVIVNLSGAAVETLEVLDAPIGTNQPTREQALEILRAQAGQQALDRALRLLGQRCGGTTEEDRV